MATSRACPIAATIASSRADSASADAFVHAGTHETFGLVVLEAMACGRPVVAMRAGAMPELSTRRAGMLAEPHEDPAVAAANLAAAIAALYERDLEALGAAARAHVVSNYSWTRALQGLMARYQSAVGVRRCRRWRALRAPNRRSGLSSHQAQPDHFCRYSCAHFTSSRPQPMRIWST